MSKENIELVDARGGWTPGKLEYKPLFSWPPKPIELIKWLFNYPDGFIFPWAVIHFSIALVSYIFLFHLLINCLPLVQTGSLLFFLEI